MLSHLAPSFPPLSLAHRNQYTAPLQAGEALEFLQSFLPVGLDG